MIYRDLWCVSYMDMQTEAISNHRAMKSEKNHFNRLALCSRATVASKRTKVNTTAFHSAVPHITMMEFFIQHQTVYVVCCHLTFHKLSASTDGFQLMLFFTLTLFDAFSALRPKSIEIVSQLSHAHMHARTHTRTHTCTHRPFNTLLNSNSAECSESIKINKFWLKLTLIVFDQPIKRRALEGGPVANTATEKRSKP